MFCSRGYFLKSSIYDTTPSVGPQGFIEVLSERRCSSGSQFQTAQLALVHNDIFISLTLLTFLTMVLKTLYSKTDYTSSAAPMCLIQWSSGYTLTHSLFGQSPVASIYVLVSAKMCPPPPPPSYPLIRVFGWGWGCIDATEYCFLLI